jgi:hypothetical protein
MESKRATNRMLLDSCVLDLEGFYRCREHGGFVLQEACAIGFDSEHKMDKLHIRVSLDDELYRSVMSCSVCRNSARRVLKEVTGLPIQTLEKENAMNNIDAKKAILDFVGRYSVVWAKGKKLEQTYLGPSICVKELEDLGCPKSSKERACSYHQPTEKLTHCAFCDVVSYVKWFISLS